MQQEGSDYTLFIFDNVKNNDEKIIKIFRNTEDNLYYTQKLNAELLEKINFEDFYLVPAHGINSDNKNDLAFINHEKSLIIILNSKVCKNKYHEKLEDILKIKDMETEKEIRNIKNKVAQIMTLIVILFSMAFTFIVQVI